MSRNPRGEMKQVTTGFRHGLPIAFPAWHWDWGSRPLPAPCSPSRATVRSAGVLRPILQHQRCDVVGQIGAFAEVLNRLGELGVQLGGA